MSGHPDGDYFFVAECPAMNECSSQAWKNGRVWGWTEEECRMQFNKHLINSGKHKNLSPEEREQLTSGADVYTDNQPDQKRYKGGTGSASSVGTQPQLAIGAAQQHMHDQQEEQLAFEEQQLVAAFAAPNHIVLREVEFESIIDSVSRAATAAKSAQRLAAGASKAFADEVAALGAVKAHLEKIRINAELDANI